MDAAKGAFELLVREALHPGILNVRLTDYKVRVLIEWSDHRRNWTTVGVSDNVIEASWRVMVDAIRLELMRLMEKHESIEKAVDDYCWGGLRLIADSW